MWRAATPSAVLVTCSSSPSQLARGSTSPWYRADPFESAPPGLAMSRLDRASTPARRDALRRPSLPITESATPQRLMAMAGALSSSSWGSWSVYRSERPGTTGLRGAIGDGPDARHRDIWTARPAAVRSGARRVAAHASTSLAPPRLTFSLRLLAVGAEGRCERPFAPLYQLAHRRSRGCATEAWLFLRPVTRRSHWSVEHADALCAST